MTANQTRTKIKPAVLMPMISDVIALGILLFFLTPIENILGFSAGVMVLFMVVFYTLFCIGVYFIRKLEPANDLSKWQPPAMLMDKRVRAGLAVIFGLLLTTILAYELGFFASVQEIGSFEMDEGGSSSFFVYMPGALLGISMLYVLVLAFPVNETVVPGSRKASIFSLLGTLFMNGFFLIWTAMLISLFQDIAIFGQVETLILSLFVLALAFVPPRLILQTKYPSEWALFSFAVLLISGSFIIGR